MTLEVQTFFRNIVYCVSITSVMVTAISPTKVNYPALQGGVRGSNHRSRSDLQVLESYVAFMQKHHIPYDRLCLLRMSPKLNVPKATRKRLCQKLRWNAPPVFLVGSRLRGGISYTDQLTHRPVIIYHVDKLRWRDESHVEVNGGWATGGRAGMSGLCSLTFFKKIWVVTKETIHSQN